MNRRAFTLIEMAVTLAIIAIVAVLAIGTFEATRRNTSVESIAFELASQVQGLRFTALAEQRDHLLVVVTPPGNDVSQCGILDAGACVRTFVLRAPQATWNVATFDPDAPGALAEFVDSTTLPRGIQLDEDGAGTPAPAPFTGVRVFEADVTALCAGGRGCLAIRFSATGEVRPEYIAAPGLTRAGVAVGITSDLVDLNRAAQRRAVMVSFPSGIARTFPY